MPEERTVFIEGIDSLEEDEEFQKLVNEAELEESALQFPRGYLSISQVNMFIRCGLQYEMRYIKDMISPPGVTLVEGSSIHKALEVGLREKMDTGKVAPASVMEDAWYGAWKEKKKEVEDWGEEGETQIASAIEKRGPVFINDYRNINMPLINPVGVEQRFWTTIGKHNIPALGYIDLLDEDKPGQLNGRVVVDHKVVKSSKSQGETDSDPQLTLYSKVSQTNRVRFDCFVKTKTPKIKTIESTRTKKDYLWLSQIFDRVGEAINLGVFLPADPTGWGCTPKFCGYYRVCRGKGKTYGKSA